MGGSFSHCTLFTLPKSRCSACWMTRERAPPPPHCPDPFQAAKEQVQRMLDDQRAVEERLVLEEVRAKAVR